MSHDANTIPPLWLLRRSQGLLNLAILRRNALDPMQMWTCRGWGGLGRRAQALAHQRASSEGGFRQFVASGSAPFSTRTRGRFQKGSKTSKFVKASEPVYGVSGTPIQTFESVSFSFLEVTGSNFSRVFQLAAA